MDNIPNEQEANPSQQGGNKMVRKITVSILSVFMLYTLTGCWNNIDLSNMSLLSAYGIDKTEDGKIMISAQIIKTPSIKSSQPNSGGGGGGETKSFYLISNTADSVFGAFHGLLTKINSRRIFLGSAQVIVFGEDIAKYGIQDYMDFILRDHKAQYKTDVIVAKNSTAKEILNQEYELSKVPGEYIRDTLKNSKDNAFSRRLMLLDVAKGLVTEGRSLAIGTIEKTEEITTTEGLAVFQKDKMIGWLDKYETRGYMYITNRLKSSVVEIKDPVNPGKTVCVELKDFKSKIKIKPGKNNMPEADIKIKVLGNIGEQSNIHYKKVNM